MKKLLTCIFIINAFTLSAQEILISFQPKVVGTKIDSIWVTNQATLEKVKVHGTDTLVLTKATGTNTIPAFSNEGYLYPNPCLGEATITFQSLIGQEVELRIYNISGQLLGIRKQNVSPGSQRFQMSFPDIGLYTVSVLKLDGSFTQKAINLSSKRQRCNIEYTGTSDQTPLKSATVKKTMNYSEGDILLYSVFSGRNNTYITDSPEQSKAVGVEFYECIDADNNSYAVVKIGDQIWMAENLKTTKFRNGDTIPYGEDVIIDYKSPPIGSYIWVNDDVNYKKIYGGLYGIHAFWYGDICPEGWYCPNNTDWATLRDYLGGLNDAGGELKSVTGWNTPNIGASNSSGFSAVPAGTGYYNNYGSGIGDLCIFGSMSKYAIAGGPEHMPWALRFNDRKFWGGENSDGLFFHSIRCLRKNASITTTAPDSITTNTAILGGNITSDGWDEIIERGICIDTTKTPTIESYKIILGKGIGSFSKKITGLIPGTTYHSRAYAINSVGTSYGEEYIFSTFYGNVTDVDGNLYPTMKIGNTIWMAENLKTTKYRDGNLIPFFQDNNSWDDLTEGAYKEYTYTTSHTPPFSEEFTNRGIFYNWYAVETGKLCPYGYHVPTLPEWIEFYSHLNNKREYVYDGNFYNITKALAAKTGWSKMTYLNEGNPGDDPSKNNSTGFSAMPSSSSSQMSEDCYWWTATEENETNASIFYMGGWGNGNLWYESSLKNEGYTVRCIKNSDPTPSVTTAAPDSIIGRSVILGGTVIYEGLSEIIERGICYSTQRSPTFNDFLVPIGKGVGVFRTKVTGLADNTTYYARAYAINSQDTVYGEEIAFMIGNKNQTSKFIDPRDNREYKTIKFGDQWWMAENLAYLPEVSPPSLGSDTIKLYYVYGYSGNKIQEAKDSSNYSRFGVLYNWTAASTECPIGWHLPSNAEWTILEKYMIENGYNYDGTLAYNKLAKSLASQTFWNPFNVAGTPGFNQDKNNSSGFSGLPGGYRNEGDKFGSMGTYCTWWTSTTYKTTEATRRFLTYDYYPLQMNSYKKEHGYSVRCVKD